MSRGVARGGVAHGVARHTAAMDEPSSSSKSSKKGSSKKEDEETSPQMQLLSRAHDALREALLVRCQAFVLFVRFCVGIIDWALYHLVGS